MGAGKALKDLPAILGYLYFERDFCFLTMNSYIIFRLVVQEGLIFNNHVGLNWEATFH